MSYVCPTRVSVHCHHAIRPPSPVFFSEVAIPLEVYVSRCCGQCRPKIKVNLYLNAFWLVQPNIQDGTEDFLATILSKLCLQMELKKSEIKKTKNKDILLWRPVSFGMRGYIEIFFRNHHWGGAGLGCYGTIRNKNSHNETNEKGSGESDDTPGSSPVGCQWCPPPISCLAPGCCIHPILCLKMWPTHVVFGPLLRNPGDGPVTLPLHIYWVPHRPRVIWKMDSGVLFHTL